MPVTLTPTEGNIVCSAPKVPPPTLNCISHTWVMAEGHRIPSVAQRDSSLSRSVSRKLQT